MTPRLPAGPLRGSVRVIGWVTIALTCLVATMTTPTSAAASPITTTPAQPVGVRCPWVVASRRDLAPPGDLAGEVLARMSLKEKAEFVTLGNGHGVENFNQGIGSLCVPSLTLADGPGGLAGLLTGVTQLPAAINLAASFDPALARAVGELVGNEARTKGIDVVQAPELNLDRVPYAGRLYETFGEDPYLSSVMGVEMVEGIQSRGVLALAKHFTAYTQEVARARLDQQVTERALVELYDAPFQAVVEEAHVAGIMCSTGLLNGQRTCQNDFIYRTLRSWGFTGLIRSDLRAVTNPAKAFDEGLDLVKSVTATTLETLVHRHRLPVSSLNRAVRTILTTMFASGLIAHPRRLHLDADAATPAHAAMALEDAEEGTVLLKDAHDTLPLSSSVGSIAVIGGGALDPLTSGLGSSHVLAPFTITPWAALQRALGSRTRLRYSSGGPASLDLDTLSGVLISSKTTLPVERRSLHSNGGEDLVLERASNVTNAIITADRPGSGRGWSHWRAAIKVKRSGEYEISLRDVGDTWLSLDGRRLLASPGLHAPSDMTTVVRLSKNKTYALRATWFTVLHHGPPAIGIVDVTPSIDAAVAVARRARVAIVFAGEESSEGSDQASLDLPGDQNLLIERVAAANPRTIVVLNTANPVLMPWLGRVAGVLEAWFPGEEDGNAIAALLTGSVDPAGRLPVTFPASAKDTPVASPSAYPGVDGVVDFGTGDAALDIGYRWYEAHHVTPLFPFGYGLSYTTFSITHPTLTRAPNGLSVSAQVANTGEREGTDVVEVYVHYPRAAGEPPEQLKAFARVTLAPAERTTATMFIPYTALRVFLDRRSVTVPGTYVVGIGSSSQDIALKLPVRVAHA